MKLLRIASVEVLNGYRVRLTLTDGAVVERDLTRLLQGPIFETQRAKRAEFETVRVVDGGLEWANGADLCPDSLIWGGAPPRVADARPEAFLDFSSDQRAA